MLEAAVANAIPTFSYILTHAPIYKRRFDVRFNESCQTVATLTTRLNLNLLNHENSAFSKNTLVF